MTVKTVSTVTAENVRPEEGAALGILLIPAARWNFQLRVRLHKTPSECSTIASPIVNLSG